MLNYLSISFYIDDFQFEETAHVDILVQCRVSHSLAWIRFSRRRASSDSSSSNSPGTSLQAEIDAQENLRVGAVSAITNIKPMPSSYLVPFLSAGNNSTLQSLDMTREHVAGLPSSTAENKLLHASFLNCVPDIRSTIMNTRHWIEDQSGYKKEDLCAVGREILFTATIADWFCTSDSSVRPLEHNNRVAAPPNVNQTLHDGHHSKHRANHASSPPSVPFRSTDLEIVDLTILFVDSSRMSVLLTYPIAKGLIRTLHWLKQYEEVLVSFAMISSVDTKYDVIECIRT